MEIHDSFFLPNKICAAPSWVMPGTIEENCSFLAKRTNEVGLLFFETESSLMYTKNDLPPALAKLPLSYHVHLPSDLPMQTPKKAAQICHVLLEKIAYLSPVTRAQTKAASSFLPAHCFFPNGTPRPLQAVLHPATAHTSDTRSILKSLHIFIESWIKLGHTPEQILLENIRQCDLVALEDFILDYGLQVCLDMGHVLAYEQHALLQCKRLLQRIAMLHMNAPGTGERAGAHLPLTALDAQGKKLAHDMWNAIPSTAILMMELFSWAHIQESLPIIRAWLPPAASMQN